MMYQEHAGVEEVRFSIPEGFSSVNEAIEHYGRICYRSEDKIKDDSADKFVGRLVKRGHGAMLEFVDAAVIYGCDRGMSHEQVRHRLVSYAQESTRYCSYDGSKFDSQITVIRQPRIAANPEAQAYWEKAMRDAEVHYLYLRNHFDVKAEDARSVLPIGLKTRIAVKTNLREWLAIFELRCDTPAHPIIRDCSKRVLAKLYEGSPEIFGSAAEKFLTN